MLLPPLIDGHIVRRYKRFLADVELADGTLVTAHVPNTGSMAGEEIVQVYIGYESSAVDRPVKDLKAFGRVHMNPGETKRLSFVIEARDLAYYNPDASSWEVEDIRYAVQIGASSRDIRLTDSFRVVSSP